MTTKTLVIKQLSRFPKTGDFDELNFEYGVNILVGEKNTGKTQWLRMLDFLMGDREPVEKAFDEVLVEKYDSIKGVFMVGDEELILERHWKQSGNKGKVFVNKMPIIVDNFSSHLLSLLNIPTLHYPEGNPLSPRTWPELSWRSLFRHIYRQQKSWGELVSKQPDVQQHACLLLFLGIAENQFSSQYQKLSDKQKKLYKLQAGKEEFSNMLNQISRELLSEQNINSHIPITEDSINSAIDSLDARMISLLNQRDQVLTSLQNNVLEEFSPERTIIFEQLSNKWARLQTNRIEISSQIKNTQSRLREMEEYSVKIEDELSRIERTKSAGEIFRNLRVTNCPVCEQSIRPNNKPSNSCYLCGQTIEIDLDENKGSEQRLDFEIEQLCSENEEAKELVTLIEDELTSLISAQRFIDEELASIQDQMKPLQVAASVILPPEISEIDMELGRIQESKKHLERIKGAIELQTNLSEQIAQIDSEVIELETEVNKLLDDIDFKESSSFFIENINQYLELLNQSNNNSWDQGKVSLRLTDKNFSFITATKKTIAGVKKQSSIGDTTILYFLPAYNYALLSLSNEMQYHYPGLSILEFPASFADDSDKEELKNHENFILEPFIDLLKQPDMKNTQLIAVGRAFEGLQGVNQVKLTHKWI
ncbi:MAG: hypothetical protein KA717_07055 [Woronichinia naegeliana WA131]|jgi:DNA repair ATPase RecN|uniref:Uncharacterized protein n=1 Tax=Woronichinia naegeliana WA131 TaxID=2824559 RepID=A0A977L0S4_9CYAN|nr:MAG: hypothetical protein KA717_07055 [Woronichinia naegeliana WA131]